MIKNENRQYMEADFAYGAFVAAVHLSQAYPGKLWLYGDTFSYIHLSSISSMHGASKEIQIGF